MVGLPRVVTPIARVSASSSDASTMTMASHGRGSRAAHRRAMVRLAAALLAVALAACGRTGDRAVGEPTRNLQPGADAEVTVLQGGSPTPPFPFVTDDAVVHPRDGTIALDHEVGPAFSSYLAPAAVPSPDERFIAYNAWTDLIPFDPQKSWSQLGVEPGEPVGTPSIRLIDLETGDDTTLADGAYSVAWRADGPIAYVEGSERDYRANVVYRGHVVVRPSLGSPAEAWTTEAAHYIVYGWAGGSLLVYRVGEGEELDVVAVDGPGHARVLAPHARIIAISPDGTRALLFAYDRRSIELLDVATGGELAHLELAQIRPAQGPPIVDLMYAGSWSGDLVAAVASRPDASTALTLFRVTGAGLELSEVLSFPVQIFPMGIAEPQLLDPPGSRVIALAPLRGKGEAGATVYAYLDCDLATARCTQGPPVTDRLFHPIYNPSRPTPEVVSGG